MVGGAHHVLVVLHHDHAVADVAQVLERGDQAVVVALVQADAGLVQHIHHARQARADLAGQADALRLAAAERLGAAVQAQVAQAHVVQELQARGDLAHHLVGDLGLGAGELQRVEPGVRIAQRGVAHFVDGAGLRRLAHLHMAGLAAQARAVAFGAGLGAAVAGQVLAHHHRIGLAVAARHVGQDALERVLLGHLLALGGAAVQDVAEGDFFLARAVQDGVLHRRGQRSNGASMSNA
jgi:hypothetical protein